ncbi:MAG: Ig-like domain-containing protein, partial [Candidatus Jordarchaeaceae archaeon]
DNSGIDYYEVKLDSGSWIYVGTSTSYMFNDVSDGPHTVYVRAFDLAGNNATTSVSFTVDTIPPTVDITLPTSGETFNTSSVTVNWTGSDNLGIDHYEVRIDGGSWINVGVSTSYVFGGLSNGSHTVEVRALDLAGNDFTDSVSFIVSLPPAAPVDLSAIILLVLMQLMRQPGVPLVYVAIGGFALVVIVAVGVALMLLRRR